MISFVLNPHILQETKRHAEKFSFLYESEVLTWSKTDFSFSYSVRVKLNLAVKLSFLHDWDTYLHNVCVFL